MGIPITYNQPAMIQPIYGSQITETTASTHGVAGGDIASPYSYDQHRAIKIKTLNILEGAITTDATIAKMLKLSASSVIFSTLLFSFSIINFMSFLSGDVTIIHPILSLAILVGSSTILGTMAVAVKQQ